MRPDAEKMNVWIDFVGKYDKHECDIMLKDGTIIEECRPNSGYFLKLGKPTRRVKSDEVSKIKYKDYFKKIKGEKL